MNSIARIQILFYYQFDTMLPLILMHARETIVEPEIDSSISCSFTVTYHTILFL